jgi:hypothetical protein
MGPVSPAQTSKGQTYMPATADFIPTEWSPIIRSKNSMIELNRTNQEEATHAFVLYSLLERFGCEQFAPGRFTVDLSHVLKVVSSEDMAAAASEKAMADNIEASSSIVS